MPGARASYLRIVRVRVSNTSHVTAPNRCATDSDYILLPPEKSLEIDGRLLKKLAAALVTRYSPDDPRMKISIATASKYVPTSVRQWGQAQIRNEGDRFKCRALLKTQAHSRDCTYVKVSVYRPLSLVAIPWLIKRCNMSV